MSSQTKPDTKEPAHPPANRSAIIHYEGFHGTPSRCHIVHRRLNDRILRATLSRLLSAGEVDAEPLQDSA